MSYYVLYSTYRGSLLDISEEPFNPVDILDGQSTKFFPYDEYPDTTKVKWVPNVLRFEPRD